MQHAQPTLLQRLKSLAALAYRKTPIPAAAKVRAKNIAFTLFGVVFQNTNAYRRWQEQRNVQRAISRLDDNRNRGGFGLRLGHLFGLRSPDAHGQIARPDDSWRDYEVVRDAVASAELQRIARIVPLTQAHPLRAQGDAGPNGLDFSAPPEQPKISIIVVAHGHLDSTLDCLTSIARHQDDGSPTIEVFVVSDHAAGETGRLSAVANVRIVAPREGSGFADACNDAAKLARGAALLLLSSEVRACAGWLSALSKELDRSPDIGVAGPMRLHADGRLLGAGARVREDGSTADIGSGDDPLSPRYAYSRDVDYCPGDCLLIRRELLLALEGLDSAYGSMISADVDLCLKARRAGYRSRYCATSRVVHTNPLGNENGDSRRCESMARARMNLVRTWQTELDSMDQVRAIAFYLPQFHPIPENDAWWGKGFTEWTNVTKAEPNFAGHYQPRRPADMGYYDLRLPEVLRQQAELARRYGIGGFCYYYYWFHGKRLLERPIEQMLVDERYDFPFCLCWANENWTRRWDGEDSEILLGQQHSDEDDRNVMLDIARFFARPQYIRIDGRPLLLVYRTGLFPDFAKTAGIWRDACREIGIGEIYIARVETFGAAGQQPEPALHGCDASLEFPPHGLADMPKLMSKLVNKDFAGFVADYRAAAVQYATGAAPAYKRFPGVMSGWDNTARRQNDGVCFHHGSPGAFQAWLERAVRHSKEQFTGDERLVFVNAWNEWAEGAYLEPDRRYGHGYLQAVANALDGDRLTRRG